MSTVSSQLKFVLNKTVLKVVYVTCLIDAGAHAF